MRAGIIAASRVRAAVGGIQLVNTATTVHDDTIEPNPVNIPAGSPGELVVMLVRRANTIDTVGSGWNHSTHTPGGSVLWRMMDGSEGATVSVDGFGARRLIAWAWRFSGAHGDVESATAEGESSPTLEPSWGSAPNAWIAGITSHRDDRTFTQPSPWPTPVQLDTGGNTFGTNRVCGAASLDFFTAASTAPGTWTPSGTTSNPAGWTIAVRPA